MFTVFGLPIHPLIVHATVVVVPAAAATVLLSVLWPRFRRWIGVGVVALPLLAVILVPLTTASGEQLEHALSRSELIQRHAQLGDTLLPWVIALLVAAIGHILWRSGAPKITRGWVMPRWLRIVVVVAAVVAAAGTLVAVIVIGHSGAAAAWSNVAGS